MQHDHRQPRTPGSAATTNDSAAPGRSTLTGALYESEALLDGAAQCSSCAGEACECDGTAAPDRPGDATWEPPDSCPTDFCKPFPSTFLAQLNKDAMWPILRLGIAAKVGIKAAGLWELWAMGGTGLLNLSALFGGDFTSSPTTATTTSFLTREISTAVAARAPVAANASETVPLANLIGPAVAAINTPGDLHEMNFAVIGDLAGNIAGGIGADQAAHPIGRRPSAQNDDRAVAGNVLIEGLASGNRRVTPTMSYTVKDTIDLCPGNCGASSEQVATVPMSRWEASGIAGDVPYSITFAPPAAGAAPFEVGSAAPATPAPKPEGGTTG